MEFESQRIDEFIGRYGREQSALIQVLQDIQAEYNYIPKPALKYLAEQLKVPLSEAYNVATFYETFSLEPKGRNHISVCLGTACHVRGAQLILEKFERELGVRTGCTSQDGEYSLDRVGCLGACALGPVVTVNGEYHGHMTLSKIDKLLKNIRAEKKDE
ncbi:MAG: NAD(P)H-dependent oxidoreductase subunit E [Candidatus Alcyoniella australis]|nr:NAD(P)H-dependent oxidoreductase subunit E [Candidatus Alcyoniella australis]